ncbi:terminase large subunit [Rhodobacter sp. 24-YEA-8]|uniref:terminase large subunit n=1 Tax=Rhodobacter sp. 24-YEA-8 TaxID=1884310 RepID=UPI0014955EF6|nr:terminase TerL endonuclease subunit [Rhodobacter sp. 24-YEA-8]
MTAKAARSPIFVPDPALYPDLSGRADRMCRFVRNLTLWEGDFAGSAFALHPFQEAIIRRIYGPTKEDGGRAVKIACIWIPRGNAKTTLAAALGLAHFMGPETEAGGQVVMAAADRENAGIAFNSAHQFVLQEEALSQRVRPLESRKTLIHPKSKSTLKAISSEAYSKHGLNVSFFLADEIHAWPAAEGRKLFKTVTDSMVKRSNPLSVIITTAGEGQGGLAWDMWNYSHKVATGEVEDPSFAPIILAADPKLDWRDEQGWRMANPAIEAGFLSMEELQTKSRRIEHFPAEIADFKRFHLNLWQEGAAEPWLALEVYDRAEAMTPISALEGRPCWIGVDLSSVEDLTAAVAVFAEGDGEARRYDVLPMFFLPEANIAMKSEKDQADYLRWADEGFLTLTPGNVVDHSAVIAYLNDLAERFAVQEVVIDRWNLTAVNTALQEEGFTVNQFGQGMASMSAPVKELKRAILSGHFRHGDSPLLRMCFGNVVGEKDAHENEKFTKAKARGRIDGAVAAAMAVGRIIANEVTPSPYEGRGFAFL